jgi:hypothetical protein
VVLAAVVGATSTACGAEAPAADPAEASPAAAASASTRQGEAPTLPRLPAEVLAVTRGRTTTFMTLEGRELARVRGYSAWTSAGPLLQRGDRLWTVRDGRAVLVRERWDVNVRGYGNGCGVLALVGRAELLSCSSVRGGAKPLLLRHPGKEARPLVPPLARLSGQWRNAFTSPDRRRLLLTWSAECEVPTAVVAPMSGARARAVTGEADWAKAPESVALGWTRDGRALVHLTGGACGSGASRPGVYAFDANGGRTRITGAADSAAFFPGEP